MPYPGTTLIGEAFEITGVITSGNADVVAVRYVDRLYRNAWRLPKLVERADKWADRNVYSVQ